MVIKPLVEVDDRKSLRVRGFVLTFREVLFKLVERRVHKVFRVFWS